MTPSSINHHRGATCFHCAEVLYISAGSEGFGSLKIDDYCLRRFFFRRGSWREWNLHMSTLNKWDNMDMCSLEKRSLDKPRLGICQYFWKTLGCTLRLDMSRFRLSDLDTSRLHLSFLSKQVCFYLIDTGLPLNYDVWPVKLCIRVWFMCLWRYWRRTFSFPRGSYAKFTRSWAGPSAEFYLTDLVSVVCFPLRFRPWEPSNELPVEVTSKLPHTIVLPGG